MNIFLSNIMLFPTVILTTFMLVVVLYWLLVILGVLDLDFIDIDLEASDGGLSGLGGWLSNWGLAGIPLTIILSFWFFYAWILCYLSVGFGLLALFSGVIQTIMGIAIVCLALVVSFPCTLVCVRPMASWFKSHSAISKEQLIGQTCVARTGEVTANFGQALYHDGEADLILDVRSISKFTIKSGDQLVIISYDKKNDIFQVVTQAEI